MACKKSMLQANRDIKVKKVKKKMCTLTKEKFQIANLREMKCRIANLDDFHSSIDSGKFVLWKTLLEVVQMQVLQIRS